MTTPLDAIMAGEPAPESRTDTDAPETETASAKAERNRDEAGKFAPGKKDAEPKEAPKDAGLPSQTPAGQGKDSQTPPAAEAPAPARQAAPDGFIPIQAHDAEKQRRRRAEEENRTLKARLEAQGNAQQPAKPAGTPAAQGDALERFLADPEGFLQEKLEPVTGRLSVTEERISERFAATEHGRETVDAAKAAALDCMEEGGTNYALLITRLKGSDHPFDELVKWHKEQQHNAKFGDEASIEAEIERRLTERLAAQQTQQPPAAKVDPKTLPSSFASTSSSAPRAVAGGGGPRPLSEIMGK